MNIQILPAPISEKAVIRQMMELYLYDLSEFCGTDLSEHGYFDYSYLDCYWTEEIRHPYLVKANSKLAGFVLVNQSTNLPDGKYCMAEFFILRKYRQKEIGRQVAVSIFNLFPGRWELYQANSNIIAGKFWQSVLKVYTKGNYTETVMDKDGWNGVIRSFDNTESR